MAIRVRMMPDGCHVALCAAKSVEQEGDLYLDDGVHYALAQKFWRDYDEVTTVDEDDILRAQSQEILTAESKMMSDKREYADYTGRTWGQRMDDDYKASSAKDVTPFEIIREIIRLGWEVPSANLILFELDKIEADNAALKRENERFKDLDFVLAKAYDLLEKASGKKDEFGAEAQIWCMQYEDALLTAEEPE